MSNKKFACAVNCMDGRTQDPINQWLEKEYGVDFVDEVTEAGVDKILAENIPVAIISDIIARVKISISQHGSHVVAIVGHADCAGNPVDKAGHLEHLRRAVKTVSSWNLSAEIIGLWVGEDWQVEKVL